MFEQCGAIDPDDGGRHVFSQEFPRLQGALEMELRLGECKHLRICCRRRDARRQRVDPCSCFPPVRSKLSEERHRVAGGEVGTGRQGRRHVMVQPGPLPRQQRSVHNLSDQVVAEPISLAVVVDNEEIGIEELAEGQIQIVLAQRGHFGQEAVIDPCTDGGSHVQHPPALLSQAPHAGHDHFAQVSRHVIRAGSEELLDEERVAPSTAGGGVQSSSVRPMTENRGHQLLELMAPQAEEFHSCHAIDAQELSQQGAEWMLPSQLVRAVTADQEDRTIPDVAAEVVDKAECERVGPVEVFEYHY